MSSETDEQYRKRIRRELVAKYARDGASNVTFVDFRRIHDELDAAMAARKVGAR